MSYLLSRGLDTNIIFFLESIKSTECSFIPFTAKQEDYAVHHFLDESGKAGYDVEKTNKLLKTEGTDFVAVALVEGDDAICINTKSGHVVLWLIQSGNGEMIPVAKTFTDFIKMSIE